MDLWKFRKANGVRGTKGRKLIPTFQNDSKRDLWRNKKGVWASVSNLLLADHSESSELTSFTKDGSTQSFSLESFMAKAKGELKESYVPKRGSISDKGITIHKLDVSRLGFHGRSEELAQLKKAFASMLDAAGADADTGDTPIGSRTSRQLFSVVGDTGTGKTALAMQLQKTVKKAGGFFISGKFGLQNGAGPYSAIVEAFSELCYDIEDRDDAVVEEITSNIREAVGSDGKLLAELIPALRELLGPTGVVGDRPAVGEANTVTEARNRLHFILRKFMRAVCCPSRPLCLLIDDVHWADASSMDLLLSLVTDVENPWLMAIVTCREKDIDNDKTHPYATFLDGLEEGFGHKKVELENLDVGHVNSMVAELIRSTEEETESLANIVYSKTFGNPFFVLEFMKTLATENVLSFYFGKMKWLWNEDDLRGMIVTDNVADLMVAKLQRLPLMWQMTTFVAACLGNSFDRETLVFTMDAVAESKRVPSSEMESSQITEVLDGLLADALLVVRETYGGKTKFAFSHDQIKAAALTLIPEKRQPLLKLLIGQKLVELGGNDEDEERFFVAVDMCSQKTKWLNWRSLMHLLVTRRSKSLRSMLLHDTWKWV
jgi:predicted ATPase